MQKQNRHNLELVWLKDCIALADKLSFSQAAAVRYVTQSAFSRRIQALEEWVGTDLFIRNRRSVALTKAGEIFCHKIPELISSIDNIRNEVLSIAGKKQPDIVIAATHLLSFSFFPELLRHNDKISRFGSFRLVSDTFQACEKILYQREAQFLLCYYHPSMQINLENEQFSSIKLGKEWLIPYSKKADKSSEPIWKIEDRKKTPYLSFSDASGIGRIVASTVQRNQVKNNMETIFTSDLALTLLAMVKGGEGVAWLPETLVQQDVQNGSIVPASDMLELQLPIEIRLYRIKANMSETAETLWQIFTENQL